MAPKDRRLQQYAAYVPDLCPALYSSANKAYASLQELKTILSQRGANLKARCFQGSTHSCELPRQLQQWNRVLGIIGVQLRERNNCGELAVVCFRSIYGLHTSWRIPRSVLLFHWLLANHRCVTALRMEGSGVFGRLEYRTVFWDAVAKCTDLKNLRFSVQFLRMSACKQLLHAVQSLPNLEEIVCNIFDVGNEYKNLSALADVISTKGKLYRLAIEDFDVRPYRQCHRPGTRGITAALQSNTAITDLTIDVSVMTEEDCRLFSQFIKESPSLMSLSLLCWIISPALSVVDIAGAVEKSQALVSLQLVRFSVDTSAAWALARSLSSAKKVQQLELISCRLDITEPNSVPSPGLEMEGGSHSQVPWAMKPFVHMLRNVKTLRRLRFPLCVSTPENERVWFDSLANEASVESVRWECQNNSFLIDLCSVVSEAGTGVEVTIDDLYRDDQQLEWITEWARVVRFFLLVNETTLAVGRFKKLLTFNSLSTLTVEVRVRIQAEQAEALAQFLTATKSLSKITISFEVESTVSMVLLDGLSHNTSITTLIIEGWCTSRRAGRFLADVVCSSKKIRSLTYNVNRGNRPRAFFTTLAKSIGNNITLLSLTTGVLSAPTRQIDPVYEVLARNNQLLVHTARFVSGRAFSKIGAEALELIGSDPMIVDKVQEMSSVNKKEAEDMIRKRLGDLDDMDGFMRAAGVVRDSVVCKESPDGRPGLAGLPQLCWRHLRQYLRLVDVVEQPWSRNAVSWQHQS
ncbi:hypothetical protein V5799_015742 [Amblyomma americanum]|uniref:Ran gtpase-activating protein n=2 Tax=Amblyomma americanum TaxID=6943 RepID=A0AAQ4DCW7_AMBAM